MDSLVGDGVNGDRGDGFWFAVVCGGATERVIRFSCSSSMVFSVRCIRNF